MTDGGSVRMFPHESKAEALLHNYEAEQGLLGALLTNNTAYERVSDFLKPEHFADPAHGRIFAAIGKLIDRGQIANPVTLKALFDQDGALAEVGGAQYLVKLAASVVAIVNAEDYGRTIHDLFLSRAGVAALEEGIRDFRTPDMDRTAAQKLDDAEERLHAIAGGASETGGPEGVGVGVGEYLDTVDRAHKAEGALIGISTGCKALDERTAGLHAPDLTTIAGPTGSGKTSLMIGILVKAAEDELALALAEGRKPRRSVLFSLEMSAEQIAGRILAGKTGISTDQTRRGKTSDEDIRTLLKAAEWLAALPLDIDDTPSISVAQARARCRRIKRRHGLLLAGFDYMQRAQGKGENRTQIVGGIARDLKTMAGELEIPVLAGSQLSRAVGKRDNKRPTLSDLRESGDIEHESDSVWLVFRAEQHLKDEEPSRKSDETEDRFKMRTTNWEEAMREAQGKAEILVDKNRHGPIGIVHLGFDASRQRFHDIERPADTRQANIWGGEPEERG